MCDNDFSQVDILHLLIYFDVKKWHIRQNMSFSSKKNNSTPLSVLQFIRQLWIWICDLLVTCFLMYQL